MPANELIPHLFKTEYGKLVAILTRTFGLDHIEVAEDIASETFVAALDHWPYHGMPPNPVAWIYTVAKNKMRNHFARDQRLKEITKGIPSFVTGDETRPDVSEHFIADSQLQMLFAVCHPAIPAESQICLALRVLCGLGLDELATAFLTNKETIHKRLQRAKRKLRENRVKLVMPAPGQVQERLESVLQTIYLLFSEGYYSESNEGIIRPQLCVEALNLAYLLLGHASTNTHSSNALMALICFQSSRLEARAAGNGRVVLYGDQDRKLWDTALIEKGFHYLQIASGWPITSTYYMEASIAYWHTLEDNNPDKWPAILRLYDSLLAIRYSPVVALNRLWAFSKVYGRSEGLEEAIELSMEDNHFYHMLLAELHMPTSPAASLSHFKKAYALCKTKTERLFIEQKIGAFLV